MFTIKATYRSETRRFTFPESVLFPTYEELYHQLYRVFPMNRDLYLSNLIFSPDASKPGRILIGREVHSAKDYDTCVAPLRRLWPNPLLRFTVFDEIPHNVPSEVPKTLSLSDTVTIPPSEVSSNLSSPVVHFYKGISPQNYHSIVPPPSPLPHPPAACVIPPSPPPPKMSICFPISSESHSRHEFGTGGSVPCCSITKGKADIEVLLSSFKEDLERILCRTFGTGYMERSSTMNADGSVHSVYGVDIIPPQSGATPVSASTNVSPRWCFVCKTSFTGVWYGCIKCPWHAVCPCCFSKSHSAHTLSFGPSHVVQQRSIDCPSQVPAQIEREGEAHNNVLGTPQSPAPACSDPTSEPEPVHRGVLCDSCNKTVMGIRHKCLDCPDYDLCTACVESGATEQHNPFHEFSDMETPGRVYVRTVLCGGKDKSLANHQQPFSSDQFPITQQRGANMTVDLPVRHSATCNLCDSAIVGERYKCVVCPDFDTCSSCFRITTEQHPNHGFVRVNKPEDLMMRDSIPLRQVAHLAVCDSCRKMIRGTRYKCMHPSCSDFNLCSDCEALPILVHPLNHPMLKLRTADTVVPTVYRVGETRMIVESASQTSAPVCAKSKSLPPDALSAPSKSPNPRPLVVSSQLTSVAMENQTPFAEEFLSPLASSATDVLAPTSVTAAPSYLVGVADSPGSPRSICATLDVYYQLRPKVNQEMMHLSVVEDQKARDPIVDAVEDFSAEPVHSDSLAREELLPNSSAASSVHRGDDRSGMCSVSPVPSTKSIVDGYCTPSTPSDDRELHCIAPQLPADHQHEAATTNGPQQSGLESSFIGDTNVPDGQIFPPGAEFVKGWHMMNNGGFPWPTTTEVQFVAGEMFAPEYSAALRAKVGVVHPGQELDIWTGDLKAPDVPGRYVGYWRLSDGQGNFFGSSVWIDLTVADHHSDQASEQSLAASSMVMPSGRPNNLANVSDELQDVPHSSLPSTQAVTDEVEDRESDIFSVFLVSVLTSDDEDAEWQDTRTHSDPLEYVVLYDSNSEE